ncbi:hypothetical protein [Methylobacterium organophilum]|nr:hypothetical protein [Methylobacterium organophilum]
MKFSEFVSYGCAVALVGMLVMTALGVSGVMFDDIAAQANATR